MASVVKVGLDPKRTTQYRKSVNQTTGAITATIQEYWRVVFDGPNRDPTLCDGATANSKTVPVIGDQYGSLTNMTVIDINPQLDVQSKGKVWYVQVSYLLSTDFSGMEGKWDTQVSFDGVPIQETTYYDLDNNPVVNACAQPFSTQPNQTYYDEAVEISFKTRSFDEEDAAAIRGYLNESDVTLAVSALSFSRTFPAKTFRLDNFRASPIVQLGSLAYWQVSLNFTYRVLVTAPSHCQTYDGTDLSGDSISTLEYTIVPNLGYAYLNDPSMDTNLTTFLDKNGQPMNSPQILDFDGGDGRPTGTPGPTDMYFLAFRLANSGDFSVLFTGIS